VSAFTAKDRPEYKLLLTQYDLKGYDKKQTALGYAPGLYGSLSYGANAFGTEANLFNRKWFGFGSLGLSLQVPIFDSYKKGAQYQQKKIDQEIVFNNLKNFESSSIIDVKNFYNIYITNLSNYKVAKENFELAKKIYDKSEIKYKNGIGSSVELAQADGTLAEERAKFVNATGVLLVSITNLEKALGKIK
jgi:outer membrane protein TolC